MASLIQVPDSKDSTQWRSLTVRLLSQADVGNAQEIVETISQSSSHISKEVMEISTRILGHPEPEAFKTLMDDLRKSIVVFAISYSKILRRQRSWISLALPAHKTVVANNPEPEKDLPQTPAGTQETTSPQALGYTTIFTCPALIRRTTVIGEEADLVGLVDTEAYQFLVYLDESTLPRREQSLSLSKRGLTSEPSLQSEQGLQSNVTFHWNETITKNVLH